MAISKEAVFDACNKLYIDDKKVTLDAVRNITGGSFSTLSPLIKEWKAKSTNIDSSIESQIAHSDVPQKLTDLLNTLWNAALSAASKQTEIERELLNNYKTELESERNEVFASADLLAAEMDDVKFNYSVVQSKCEELKKENTELNQENEELNQTILLLNAELAARDASVARQDTVLNEITTFLKTLNHASSVTNNNEVNKRELNDNEVNNNEANNNGGNNDGGPKDIPEIKLKPKSNRKAKIKDTNQNDASTGDAPRSAVPLRGKTVDKTNSPAISG